MFKATKPFRDTITGYPQQPSLRIGRVVPQEAVNLAYYFNPTATDAEKILTAEAPRNTIDHRIEEAYRYLFDQASDDDDLFPGCVSYEDEEGYTGKLGRMFVRWYPESHALTKHLMDVQQDVIVTNREDVPRSKEYSDIEGYEGTLFLDAATFEVSNVRDETSYEQVEREINNFELDYHSIYDKYIPQGPGGAIDTWTLDPTADSSSPWPMQIRVSPEGCAPVDECRAPIRQYLADLTNTCDDASGVLTFVKVEYEPVAGDDSGDVGAGSRDPTVINFGNVKFRTEDINFEGNVEDIQAEGDLSHVENATNIVNSFIREEARRVDQEVFRELYVADYDATTGKYDYSTGRRVHTAAPEGGDELEDRWLSSIAEFLSMVESYCSNSNAAFVQQIRDAMEDGECDIAIYRTSLIHVIDDEDSVNSTMHFEATYEGKISYPIPRAGNVAYNVIAVYGGTLNKRIEHQIHVASEYTATCHYSGIARKVWETYDGMAYYRGSVTKGNSIGNVNPEDDNEILMFPDINGYLRRPIYVTDDEGNVTLKNLYKIETDYAYLTNVFKDGIACFWKYDLKGHIYDYRGPDSRGFYEGNAVKVFTSSLKDLPSGYVYNMRLVSAEYETVQQITSGFVSQPVQRPVRYHVELFTSFLSTATDTYKVTYNAFNDNDRDNIALDNGVTEEIYNYPFMIQNRDFTIESVNRAERTSRIKLNNNCEWYIEDTRHYITFSFVVVAERKQEYGDNEQGAQEIVKSHRKIQSSPITVNILNRDYALASELNKFDGRGMIVSPQSDGIYKSPFDIILAHQAQHPPVPQDENGIYIGTIYPLDDSEGTEPIEYNPDYVYRDQFVYNESGEKIARYEEYENIQEVLITSRDTDFYFYTVITECEDNVRGGINLKCNPDGSGFITAETTIDTGFWNPVKQNWTKKLSIDNPYFIEQCSMPAEDGTTVEKTLIFPGIKVKCIDARHVKVLAPREDGLLDSWYPRIQFGHYSQVLDQYGTHTKACYSVPEYETQYFSPIYRAPYVDVKGEQVEILNTHMVKTKCFPLMRSEVSLDSDSYRYNDTVYRVYKKEATWDEAKAFCESVGGRLAVIPNREISNFISEIASNYENVLRLWIGATSRGADGQWTWVDGSPMTFTNWAQDQPDNSEPPEDCVEIYTSDQCQWNDLKGSTKNPGFICEFNRLNSVKLYKKVGSDLYSIIIKDISFSEGIIITDTAISENDNIVCDYTYLEESYVYRGFWKTEQDFARIDLNPNIYHTYSDITYSPSATKPTKNLFNKVIYFFMRPSLVFEVTSQNRDDLIFDFDDPEYGEDDIRVIEKNEQCLYHKIDDSIPDKDWDIYIGSVYIRQNTSLTSTILVDSRTRGGGLIESMKDSLRKQLEPESDYYLDIGFYDGEPYQENGVIIVRLDQRLLQEFGGRFTKGDIEVKVKRWLGYGVYPIIEYVDTYTKRDLPQHTLVVDDAYGNIVNITPEIYLEYRANL